MPLFAILAIFWEIFGQISKFSSETITLHILNNFRIISNAGFDIARFNQFL